MTMTMEKDKSSAKKRGLGRGLGALFEDEEATYPQPDPSGHTPGATRRMAGLDQLEPGPFQPRQHIDNAALQELSDSIATHGVLQPILVRLKPGFEDRFQIIAGERRWRAAQKARLHEVPIIVKTLDDDTALEIALIENLQREDLNPLEEALGYKRLLDEFGHTQEKLAKGLGKSRPHIANMLRLLALPDSIQILVRQSKLSAGHARALAAMEAGDAEDLARYIISHGLSVREAEELAAASKGQSVKKRGTSKKSKDVDTVALEREMTNVLGMKVTIDTKTGGVGTLKIDYKSLDQLDDVLRRLSHNPGRGQAG